MFDIMQVWITLLLKHIQTALKEKEKGEAEMRGTKSNAFDEGGTMKAKGAGTKAMGTPNTTIGPLA
jgi:hypothetical protein